MEVFVNRAGAPAALPIFRLDVTVFVGALSDRRKQGLVEEATQLILEAEDGERDGMRVWVHIHELPDGNWGAAGQLVRFELLRAAAEQARGAEAATAT